MDDDPSDGFSQTSLHGRPATPPVPGAAPARSRRGFLIAGGIAVVGATGGGIALGRAAGKSDSATLVAHPPAELAAAAEAERALIALAEGAAAGVHGRRQSELGMVRANHAAHLAALEALIDDAVYPAVLPSTSTSRSASSPPPAGVNRTAVRAAERRAAATAAARAARLSGRTAVLLASIAAAEAAHAELLS